MDTGYCHVPGGEIKPELMLAEEELTQQVPLLLDTMNRASTEANTLELRVGEAQQRYKVQLAECSKLYDDLRVSQGREFARVKPYFFASQELKATLHHMQAVAREFSEASLEYTKASKASNCTEAARLKEKRDRLEEQYAHCLSEYQAAQKSLETLRTHLGDAAITRAYPFLEMLQD